MRERDLILAVRRSASRQEAVSPTRKFLRLGIGDDCAILRPSASDEIVVTTDLFLEQVHFRRDWHQPEVAGHRCLARGLSDIAAMGATPGAAFLSFAVPPELVGEWTQRFLAGLLRLARLHDVPLAGGDTAQSPGQAQDIAARGERSAGSRSALPGLASHPGSPQGSGSRESMLPRGVQPGDSRRNSRRGRAGALFVADIVLLGSVPRGRALLRSGAQPGDAIYVTGSLGGAAAELALLEQSPGVYARLLRGRRSSSAHPHLFPQPRLAVGRWLLRRATAAIDISDGLSTDLAHLAEESHVAARIEQSLLPIHALAARNPRRALDLTLHGGEDYELLFTAPPNRRVPALIAGTPIHRIGSIVPAGRGRPRITLVGSDGRGRPLRDRGWEHFGQGT